MNIPIQQRPAFIYSITLTLALCAVTIASPVKAQQPDALDSQETWQANRLFAPTTHQREQEKNGTVVIYDGLKGSTVDNAMDKAFERIQNMMFIRIIHTDKDGQPMHDDNGEVMVDDDDC